MGIRKCSKCGKLFKIKDEGPEAMTGDFPKHLCGDCKK